MAGQKGKFSGTAKKIEKYLKSKVGQKVEVGLLRKELNLGKENTGVNAKIKHLQEHGKIERIKDSSPLAVKVLAAILGDDLTKQKNTMDVKYDKITNNNYPSFFNGNTSLMQTDTQKAFRNDIEQAASIDIAETMSRVIKVNEQNKMLRDALENIVLILDQAGVIEKSN